MNWSRSAFERGASSASSALRAARSHRLSSRAHRLTLRRGGGRLTISVDGERTGAADVPGPVSRDSPFGVHIGQRVDGRAFFTGAIDDAHVGDRALSDEAPAGRATSPRDTVLRLPMDQVSGGH